MEAVPVVLAADPVDELTVLAALVVPLPGTTSPTCPESETMVPLSGAYSLVSWTACSSLCTVSVSLLTAALAEARLASRVAVLIVDLDELAAELDALLSASRTLARLASADSSDALACSRVTSALCGSSVAISCPWVTCWPCETYMCVNVPYG